MSNTLNSFFTILFSCRNLNVWSNDEVTVLQNDIFGDISFKYLNVYNAPNLVAIRPSVLLASRDTLVDASFGFGRLKSFPWWILPRMRALTRLDFQDNELTRLPALESDTLQYLIFRDNRISSVKDRWTLPALKHLDLGQIIRPKSLFFLHNLQRIPVSAKIGLNGFKHDVVV